MGYYVRGHGQITIKSSSVEQAYQALCDLNNHDEMKRGGSYGGLNDGSKPRPDGLTYHPGRWFSWMDANYPETCPDLWAVLSQVGFEMGLNENGELIEISLNYDEKSGQEDLFLEALAPFCVSGSIEWSGEDGEGWLNEFTDGTMTTKTARIVYE